MKKIYKKLTTRNERGFTLIELLVVIAIIAVLAALVLAALSSAQKGSRDSRRRSDSNQYKTALIQYNADGNAYFAGTGLNLATDATFAVLVPTYMNPRPTAPTTGAAASQRYNYTAGAVNGFCIDVLLERSANYIRTTATRQYENAAVCAAADGE